MLYIGKCKSYQTYKDLIKNFIHENKSLLVGDTVQFTDISNETLYNSKPYPQGLDLIMGNNIPERFLFSRNSIGNYYYDEEEDLFIIRGTTKEEQNTWFKGGREKYLEMLKDAVIARGDCSANSVVTAFPPLTCYDRFLKSQLNSDEKLSTDLYLKEVMIELDKILSQKGDVFDWIFPRLANEDTKITRIHHYTKFTILSQNQATTLT